MCLQKQDCLCSASYTVWNKLDKSYRQPDENLRYWWERMGRPLAVMLHSSGYTANQQYEALLFYQLVIVPYLGPRPASHVPPWKSFMTDDHTPIEYSWKWPALPGDGLPEIRYAIEAMGPGTGTSADRLNQAPALALLDRVTHVVPGVDLALFHHFRNALFSTEERSVGTDAKGTDASTLLVAFDIGRKKVNVKAYFIPVGQPTPSSAANQILAAAKSAPCANLSAIKAMETFLDSESSSTLQPFMIAIDCVEPSTSRIKVYVRSPQTSFDFTRHVLTLGGLHAIPEDTMVDIHDLWTLTLGIDASYPQDKDLSNPSSHATAGMCFNLDVGPKGALPRVKAYIPVRHYSSNDNQVTGGLRTLLERKRCAGYASAYQATMHALEVEPGKALQETGIQTYISCAIEQGKLNMTSYLSPQIYHPARYQNTPRAFRQGRNQTSLDKERRP